MKHDVKFSIPIRELGKSDVVFEVWADGDKLGRLEVSKGSLVWFPKDKTFGHKIGWSKFDQLMQNYPKHETR